MFSLLSISVQVSLPRDCITWFNRTRNILKAYHVIKTYLEGSLRGWEWITGALNSVKSGSVVSTYTQGTHSLLPLEFQGKVVLQWPRHDNRIFPRKSTARAEAYYIDPSIQSCVTSDFGLLVHLCGLQRPLISIKFGGRVLQLPYPKNAHTQDSERFSFSSYAGSSSITI